MKVLGIIAILLITGLVVQGNPYQVSSQSQSYDRPREPEGQWILVPNGYLPPDSYEDRPTYKLDFDSMKRSDSPPETSDFTGSGDSLQRAEASNPRLQRRGPWSRAESGGVPTKRSETRTAGPQNSWSRVDDPRTFGENSWTPVEGPRPRAEDPRTRAEKLRAMNPRAPAENSRAENPRAPVENPRAENPRAPVENPRAESSRSRADNPRGQNFNSQNPRADAENSNFPGREKHAQNSWSRAENPRADAENSNFAGREKHAPNSWSRAENPRQTVEGRGVSSKRVDARGGSRPQNPTSWSRAETYENREVPPSPQQTAEASEAQDSHVWQVNSVGQRPDDYQPDGPTEDRDVMVQASGSSGGSVAWQGKKNPAIQGQVAWPGGGQSMVPGLPAAVPASGPVPARTDPRGQAPPQPIQEVQTTWQTHPNDQGEWQARTAPENQQSRQPHSLTSEFQAPRRETWQSRSAQEDSTAGWQRSDADIWQMQQEQEAAALQSQMGNFGPDAWQMQQEQEAAALQNQIDNGGLDAWQMQQEQEAAALQSQMGNFGPVAWQMEQEAAALQNQIENDELDAWQMQQAQEDAAVLQNQIENGGPGAWQIDPVDGSIHPQVRADRFGEPLYENSPKQRSKPRPIDPES